MNGDATAEPDDPNEMRFSHFLHRPVTVGDGTFMIHTCPHDDHPNCVLLTGQEFDPSDDTDTGVYYHANAGCIKRNIVSERINWELAEMSATLSRVHGDGGTGRHPKVRSRVNSNE